MQKINWAEHILVDPEIHHWEPRIRGTRVPVAVVLGSLAQELSPEEVIREYPSLSRDDIQACLAYAAEVIRSGELLLPLHQSQGHSLQLPHWHQVKPSDSSTP